MQGGFTKHCFFLCLWYSRATKEHYIRRDWPVRESHLTGVANIKNVPLVDLQKILWPPLHIKLGLMKNFVKAMGKCNPSGFAFLYKNFPSISQAKLKEGIFVGPQHIESFHQIEPGRLGKPHLRFLLCFFDSVLLIYHPFLSLV